MNKIPSEYKCQILQGFFVNQDMESLDFISYDDRYKPKPIHIITITREELEKDLIEHEDGLVKFYSKFKKYYGEVTF